MPEPESLNKGAPGLLPPIKGRAGVSPESCQESNEVIKILFTTALTFTRFLCSLEPLLAQDGKMYRLLSQLNAAIASLYLLHPQLHRRFVTFSPAVSVFKITLCSTLYTRTGCINVFG